MHPVRCFPCRSRYVLAVAALGVLAPTGWAAPADKPVRKDPVKEEVKKLEGTWQAVAFAESGRQAPPTLTDTMTWTFQGNRFTWRFSKDKVEMDGTYTINPGKKPKQIDLADKETDYKGVGIYALDGDTLKIRFHQAGDPRPIKFSTRRGTSDQFLLILKRVKK